MTEAFNYPDNLYAEALASASHRASLTDTVSKPPHYDLGKYQAIDVIVEVAKTITDPVEATFASHMLKYALRWPRKGGLQDLYKERQYLDWLIAHVEQRTGGVEYQEKTLRKCGIGDVSPSTELPPNLRDAVLLKSGIGDVEAYPNERETRAMQNRNRPVMAAEADRLKPGDML